MNYSDPFVRYLEVDKLLGKDLRRDTENVFVGLWNILFSPVSSDEFACTHLASEERARAGARPRLR